MSRLDYFTIGIVAVCILAIVFLLYRATDLFKSDDSATTSGTELYEEDPYSDEETSTTDYDTSPEAEPYTDYETEDTSTIVYDLDDASTDDYEEPEAETAPKTEKSSTSPSSSSRGSSSSSSSYGDYLVLAGSFTIKANAESHQTKLEKMGYDDSEVTLFNGGKYASVLVDRFDSESAAAELALVGELKGKGIEAYVHKKRVAKE